MVERPSVSCGIYMGHWRALQSNAGRAHSSIQAALFKPTSVPARQRVDGKDEHGQPGASRNVDVVVHDLRVVVITQYIWCCTRDVEPSRGFTKGIGHARHIEKMQRTEKPTR